MAAASHLSSPQPPLSNDTPLGANKTQHTTLSDELRYTLESYEPSQVLSTQDRYPPQEALSTQGYSSGYGTCSIEAKTQEPQLQFEVRGGTDPYSSEEEVRQKHITVGPSFVREDSQRSYRQHFYGTEYERDYCGMGDYPHQNGHHLIPGRPVTAILRQLQELSPLLCSLLKSVDHHLTKRQLNKAAHCLEQSIQHSEEFPRLQSLMSMLLGEVHMEQRQYKKASCCYLRHLTYCRETQDFRGMARAECKLGIVYLRQGLLKLAGRCFMQHLENARILQDDMGVAAACNNLGTLSRLLGIHGYRMGMRIGNCQEAKESLHTNTHRAMAYFEQHRDIMEHYGDLEKQARAYGNLGVCYELLKQHTQALFCQTKRLEIARILGDSTSECSALCSIGNCFRASGQLQRAIKYYHFAYELSGMAGNRCVEISVLSNLGTTCELTNQLQRAIEWNTMYLGVAVQYNDLRAQVQGFRRLAALYEETNQTRKAIYYCEKLVELFKRVGDNEARLSATQHLQAVRQIKNKKHKQSKKLSHSTPSGRQGHASLLVKHEPTTSKRNKVSARAASRQLTAADLDTTIYYPPLDLSASVVFENPITAFLQNHQKLSEHQLPLELAEQTYLTSPTNQSMRRLSPDATLCSPYMYNSQHLTRGNEDFAEPCYQLVHGYNLPWLPSRDFSDSEISNCSCNYDNSAIDNESPTDMYRYVYRPDYPIPPSPVDWTLSEGGWDSDENTDQLDDPQNSDYEGSQEVDKEWEQWINLRDLNSLCRVVSMTREQIRERRSAGDKLKPTHSAPSHIDLSSTPDEEIET